MAVYEVIFADPFSVESAAVATTVSYSPNLNLNQPTPGQIAQAFGGFAPFYSTSAAHLPSSTLTDPALRYGADPQQPELLRDRSLRLQPAVPVRL